ncbi:MAG: hypothetical protein KGQ52_02490 [Alphaproteobacteria bacterium]|nr:hypothetical protein [Alphaproteobacteria bacterium]
MSLALLLAAVSFAGPTLPPPSPLAGLVGCWRVRGTVEGKAITATARGSWRLGGRYLLFELHGLNTKQPQDIAIIMADAGPGQLTAWWMDRFGGPGSAAGRGGVIGTGLSIRLDYGSAVLINRFTPYGAGWRWQIDAKPTGRPASPVASHSLAPARCTPGFSVF